MKLEVTDVYEAIWYIMVSVCVPTVEEELEEKVNIGEPEVVDTVT
jgi:hypothetical protein